MSNHNYSQYSNKKHNRGNSDVAANAAMNNSKNQNSKSVEKISDVDKVKMDTTPKPIQPVLVKETVETVALPDVVIGVVAHCAKLNVREKPVINSSIVCVLDVMSEIKIDVTKSTENWFYVCAANGAEGYCMREYVDAHM